MQHTFQYNSLTIHYRDVGQGLPVLLLHGFGEDSHIWDHQIDYLQKSCRLIVPDLPGSGQSATTPPSSAEINTASSIDRMAEAMMALAEQAGSGPYIVLGHSMGGYIALAMAEKKPTAIRALGLVHSTAFADSEEKKATRRKGIQFIRQHGAYAFLQTATPGLFGELYKKDFPEQVEALTENGKKFAAEALVAYYEAMIARPDRTAVLTGSPVPFLFIVGMQDKAVPPDDVLQQVHLPHVSYVHILEEAAHMGMWEEKDKVNQYLETFIKQVSTT